MRNRFHTMVAVCAAAVVLGLAGCNGFFVDQELTSLALTPANPTVPVGGTAQLHVTGVNNDGSQEPVSNATFTSANSTVATVSPSGLVTGVSTGSTTITASAGTVSGSATVNVGTTPAGGLSIAPTDATVSRTAGSQQFTATLNGQDVTASTSWTSSNNAVAQFNVGSPAGLATLTGQGTTTITATNTSNGTTVTATTTLTVGP